MNLQATPPTKPTEPQKPVEKKMTQSAQWYQQYMSLIDTEAENAFENILWKGHKDVSIQDMTDTKLVFQLNSSFILLFKLWIREVNNGFIWQSYGVIIAKATGKIKQEMFWTRKERKILVAFGMATLFAVGRGKESYTFKNSVLRMTKFTDPEEFQLIRIAAESRDNEKVELRMSPAFEESKE